MATMTNQSELRTPFGGLAEQRLRTECAAAPPRCTAGAFASPSPKNVSAALVRLHRKVAG